MKTCILVAACAAVIALGGPAAAMDAATCGQINKQGAAGGLAKMTGDQLKDQTCTTTLAASQAAEKNDTATRDACFSAATALTAEFEKRWPDEDVDAVMARCQ